MNPKHRNRQRARAGNQIISQWIQTHKEEYEPEGKLAPDVALIDLLTNLMHARHRARNRETFDYCLSCAKKHFRAEMKEEGVVIPRGAQMLRDTLYRSYSV